MSSFFLLMRFDMIFFFAVIFISVRGYLELFCHLCDRVLLELVSMCLLVGGFCFLCNIEGCSVVGGKFGTLCWTILIFLVDYL